MNELKSVTDVKVSMFYERIVLKDVRDFFDNFSMVFRCEVILEKVRFIRKTSLKINPIPGKRLISFLDAKMMRNIATYAEDYGFEVVQASESKIILSMTLYDTDEMSEKVKSAGFRKELIEDLLSKNENRKAKLAAEKFVKTFMLPRFKEMKKKYTLGRTFCMLLDIEKNLYIRDSDDTNFEELPCNISENINNIILAAEKAKIKCVNHLFEIYSFEYKC